MRKIQHNLVPALLAAVIAALVIIPIFGLELKRAGMTMGLESHWSFVLWGSLAVFIVQLLKPALQARTAGLGLSLPKLPSLPAQWAKPLMFAALFNRTDIIELLLAHGARADCQDQQGNTALACAKSMNAHDAAAVLEKRLGA